MFSSLCGVKTVESVRKLTMLQNTTYCYKGSGGFTIENGIMRGAVEPYITGHDSYGEFMLERLRASPEFIGQINGSTGEEQTFALMAEKSVKCATWLKQQDIKPGDIIGICSHNHMDMYVPCLASLYVGAVLNSWWNDGITSMMIRHFITVAQPKILFADEASADLILSVIKEMELPLKVVVIGNLSGFLSLDDIFASQDVNCVSEFRCTKLSSLDEPALILFTSGSTGLPKGAVHSQRGLFGNIKVFSEVGTFEGPATLMTFTPLAWATGINALLRSIFIHETRIVYPEFTERVAFQLIEKFKVNWMLLGYNPTIRLMKSSESSNYDLSSLKYYFVTGATFKKDTHEAVASKLPQTQVIQVFGSTELGGVTMLEQPGMKTKPGSCGRIAKNMSMKVIDIESGAVLGPNETGEAYIKSPHMMIGYYENPEATNEIIDDEGWLHTGDLVYYDEEGSVFVIDRIKEMIKCRDCAVSPMMIEQLLQTHPAILEVAVVSVPHPVDFEHPMAFVVKMPNAEVTEQELHELVADKLPPYMTLLGGIEFITELPHTSTGKIRRSDLKKMVWSR